MVCTNISKQPPWISTGRLCRSIVDVKAKVQATEWNCTRVVISNLYCHSGPVTQLPCPVTPNVIIFHYKILTTPWPFLLLFLLLLLLLFSVCTCGPNNLGGGGGCVWEKKIICTRETWPLATLWPIDEPIANQRPSTNTHPSTLNKTHGRVICLFVRLYFEDNSEAL